MFSHCSGLLNSTTIYIKVYIQKDGIRVREHGTTWLCVAMFAVVLF